MLEHLRTWLNGGKDYNVGVALYAQFGSDKQLAKVLITRRSSYLEQRLYNELLAIYDQQNHHNGLPNTTTISSKHIKPEKEKQGNGHQQIADSTETTVAPSDSEEVILNPELHNQCLEEAHMVYKECMNLRAVLFKSVPDLKEQVNAPDLVRQRSTMAIEVVKLSLKYSKLYDRADFVAKHGRLPIEESAPEPEVVDADSIPDHLVKEKLDLARKSLGKLKAKQPTPERIQLIQERESLIEKLNARWLSLKATR